MVVVVSQVLVLLVMLMEMGDRVHCVFLPRFGEWLVSVFYFLGPLFWKRPLVGHLEMSKHSGLNLFWWGQQGFYRTMLTRLTTWWTFREWSDLNNINKDQSIKCISCLCRCLLQKMMQFSFLLEISRFKLNAYQQMYQNSVISVVLSAECSFAALPSHVFSRPLARKD